MSQELPKRCDREEENRFMSVSPSEPGHKLGPQAATFLATEHWSLLGTRSMTWNEAFSRVSMFLNTLSASAVALALAADASGFGRSFRLFAMVLFPIVLFLGVTTYLRLCQINLDDVYLLAAMNRLRRAYVDEVPELEKYITAGWNDDAPGVWQSLMLDQPRPSWPLLHAFVTTPTIIATIDAAVATAGGALLLTHYSVSGASLLVFSTFVFLFTRGGLLAVQYRQMTQAERHAKVSARFPSEL
jgi:hypothetical protein